MATQKTTGLFYNLILLLALVLLLMTSLLGLEVPTSVALEQSPRCGQAEHLHTDECYLGEVLLCSRKAHTHAQGCYLVSLKDNDINWLLQTVSETDDGALESLIRSVMRQALRRNENYTDDAALVRLNADDLAALNGTIREHDDISTVLLNQNLDASTLLEFAPMDGMVTLAVGDTPGSEDHANFYIYVDNKKYVFIGKCTITENGSNDYVPKSDVAALHNTTEIISNITAESIETGYYANNGLQVRYTTSQPNDSTAASRFSSNANYVYGDAGNLSFGNAIYYSSYYDAYISNPRYVTLMTGSTDNNTSVYTPINFYTVTLDYSNCGATVVPHNEVKYVQSGVGLTLPDGYAWYTAAEGGTRVDSPYTITTTTTLYARPSNYTVTFDHNYVDSIPDTVSVERNGTLAETNAPVPTREGYTFGGWYTDAACTTKYNFGSTVTADMTLYAKWLKDLTVTFHYNNGTADTTEKVVSGGTISAPTAPAREGHTFSGWYTDEACTQPYTFGATVTEDLNLYAKWDANTYKVTVKDENGNVTEQTTREYGKTYTLGDLPDGYVWAGSDGKAYAAGTEVAITKDMTFTRATKTITVKYDIAFPSNLSGDPLPTIYGTTVSTAEEIIPSGNSAIALSLNSRKVRHEFSSGNKESLTHFFLGWTIDGTDVLIQPGTRISWEELEGYANADGVVNLKGKWQNGDYKNSVTFFIRLDSVAVDTDGNIGGQDSSNYTPEVFNTYLGGEVTKGQNIADTTSDNSYGADQAIRALYGERDTGIWMYDFPNDDDMFRILKEYNESHPNNPLSVDGVPVKTEELDKEHYAIRWYVFKSQSSSWHVDGKLVKREGVVTVDKAFKGDDTAVNLAKQGFYIVAENGTKNDDGSFAPFTDSKYRQIVMTLDQATADSLKEKFPNATYMVLSAEDLAQNDFEWKINQVTLGEYWHITEYPNWLSDYSYYAEYSIHDTTGDITARAESGTNASVVGKAFALDEDPDQGLFVDFTNYYYPNNSILLKKEDGLTGAGIGGAEFRVQQITNGEGLIQILDLKFDYDAATGVYTQSPDGVHDTIRTSADGFVVIDGFSYQHGNTAGTDNQNYLEGSIIITETVSPTGYSPAPEIALGLDANNNVALKAVGELDESEWADYANLPSNEILEIRNYNTDYVSVTANKIWNTTTPEQSVEVVLQANGHHATLEIPSLSNAQVVLNAANNWTYTWENLPRYANGAEVTWGIKEVVIGGMPTMSDGVSFANWIPTYSPGAGSDTDGDGKIDNWSYTVTNATRRPQLILTKVDDSGTVIPNATFKLEQLQLADDQWTTVSGSASTLSTNASGMLTFDNLLAGQYYRLTEVSAPDGYLILMDPIILSVNGDGLVQKVNSDGTLTDLNEAYVTYTSLYNIQVTNLKQAPLPETGGTGTKRYTQSGMLLILAAIALWIYNAVTENMVPGAQPWLTEASRRIPVGEAVRLGYCPAPPEPVPRSLHPPHGKEEKDSS